MRTERSPEAGGEYSAISVFIHGGAAPSSYGGFGDSPEGQEARRWTEEQIERVQAQLEAEAPDEITSITPQ